MIPAATACHARAVLGADKEHVEPVGMNVDVDLLKLAEWTFADRVDERLARCLVECFGERVEIKALIAWSSAHGHRVDVRG